MPPSPGHRPKQATKKTLSHTSPKAPVTFASAPPHPVLSPKSSQPRTPRPSPAVSPTLPPSLPLAISSTEIEVAFAFLTAYNQDPERITLSTLQKRLGPLLFPTSTASDGSNTSNKTKSKGPPSLKTQEAFFRSLLPRASTIAESDMEPSLTLAELKELLLLTVGSGAEILSVSGEKKKSPLEAAFKYLDHEGNGAVDPAMLVSAVEKLEGLVLGEGAGATLVRAVDVGGYGLIGLKDFKWLARLLHGEGGGNVGAEEEDDDDEGEGEVYVR